MIVKISRGSYVAGVINYHEEKVKEGVAEVISNNTLEDKTNRKIACFMENFELNTKVQKNKFAHFSFALSPEENLDSEKFKEIAREYLTKMGYTDTPELMYRHFDGATEHIHVVCSSIKYSGEKIAEFQDFKRGKEICRELEKTYDLKVVQGADTKQQTLEEINAKKYSLSNGLKRALKAGYQTAFWGNKEVDRFSNDDFLKEFGKNQFEKLFSELDLKGYIYKTNKMQLEEKLDFIYSSSQSKDEFLGKLQENEIYSREVKNLMNYGYNGVYFTEKQLDRKYGNNHLVHSFGVKEQFSEVEQKFKLKREVALVVGRAKGYNDFVASLALKGIEVKEAKNSGGIYGLSFKLEGEKNIYFKASDLDRKLSFENIMKRVDNNLVKELSKEKAKVKSKPEKEQAPKDISKSGTPAKSPFSKISDDPEDLKRKRRQEREDQNDQNISNEL